MSQPRCLYLSPVIPARTGNGLAMRAAAVLRGLAGRYRMQLRVHPLYASPTATLSEELTALCDAVEILDPAVPPNAAGLAPDLVHVFRLASLPYAVSYLDSPGRPLVQLDLDDIESATHGRLAALHAANGEADLAAHEEHESRQARLREDAALQVFDRVFVCSDIDRRALLERGPAADVRVLPNAVDIPKEIAPPPPADPFVFLFVGTLGYYPNVDALEFFCREVLPRVRADAGCAVELHVVGVGAPPRVLALAALPGVRIVGAVPDVGPSYAASHAVIAPIRAGGGTRIKILEAFAHRRPVVSTTLGAEGLEITLEQHLLLGDSPMELASHCLRLIREPELRTRLAEEALSLIGRSYSPEALPRTLASLPALEPRSAPR